MSKYIRITVLNTGGEYTFGVIEDEVEKQAMLNAIENNEVSSSIYYKDGDGEEISLESFNNANILATYGPSIDSAQLIIVECEDDSFVDEVSTFIDTPILESGCILFTSSNPYCNDELKSKFSNDSLLWGTQKIEKRVHLPAELILSDKEEFEITNIFIGSMNMDETINSDEIVDVVYYIRPDVQLKLLKEYYGDDYTEDDKLGDILSDLLEEKPDMFDQFKLDIGDIEGKGEYENDFNIVTTFDGEILYQGGEY